MSPSTIAGERGSLFRPLLLATGWCLLALVGLACFGPFWRWFIDAPPATCNIHGSGEILLLVLLPPALLCWLVVAAVAMRLSRHQGVFTRRDRQFFGANVIGLAVTVYLWFLPC